VKVGAGYKYTSKLSRKTSISDKGGVEAIDPFPKAGPGFDSKTSYGIKGGLGYQKELDNGIVFFVDTGLSYPISKSEPTAPQQDKEKSSRKQSFKPMPEPAVSIGFKY
jgi:hypothetical protein